MSWGPVGGLAVGEIALGTGSGGQPAAVPYPLLVQPHVRVTQLGNEVWVTNQQVAARVSQIGMEVWAYNAQPAVHVTQLGVEVWVDISRAYVPPTQFQPSICIIT